MYITSPNKNGICMKNVKSKVIGLISIKNGSCRIKLITINIINIKGMYQVVFAESFNLSTKDLFWACLQSQYCNTIPPITDNI